MSKKFGKKVMGLISAMAISTSVVAPLSVSAENIAVNVNGTNVNFENPPIIVNDRTLVPLRAIFEALGATVLWDDSTQVVNVATDFGLMTLSIESPYISYRNEYEDKSVISDVAPQLYKDRTYVPVRIISELAGYTVDWDENTKTVSISGTMSSMTLPEADNKGFYENSKIPDFGACYDVELINQEDLTYTYNGVTGQQIIDYIEKNLASVGFTIDTEDEGLGMFIFVLSNKSTSEHIRLTYSKSDKVLYVTISK